MESQISNEFICTLVLNKGDKIPDSIPVQDFRSTKPKGVHNKKNSQTGFFQDLLTIKIENSKAALALPNEIAISLSIAHKATQSALKSKKELLAHIKKNGKTLFKSEVCKAYDCLEEMQVAVVFSYKAVESFCNASIPNDYIYQKVKLNGIVEIYGREQIERWINTTEKVSEILPKLLGVDSPTKEAFWSDFKNLERVRNEIVHSKSNTSQNTIAELYSNKMADYLQSSVTLLEHFILKDPDNIIYPFGFGASKVKVWEVEDAGELFSLSEDS